jgi:hypothetical protein
VNVTVPRSPVKPSLDPSRGQGKRGKTLGSWRKSCCSLTGIVVQSGNERLSCSRSTLRR